jgi:hypothetical protein
MRDLTLVACALVAGTLVGCSGPAPGDPLINWDYSPKGDGGAVSPGSTGAGSSSSSSSSSSGSGTTSSSSGGGSSSGGATGSSGGTGSSGAGTSSGGDAGSGTVPCAVATVLAAKCTGCHSDPPANGSLAGLVTYANLRATAIEDPTKNEAQLAVVRMQSTTSPMPPASFNNPATASDIATLQNWISAGYPSGSCGADAGPPPSGAVDVFAQAPAFASQTAGSSHNAGRDCMGCHAGGGGDAPQFAFGGTLYDGSGKGLAGAEVRIVDSSGKATSVYTGPEGNFHGSGTLATPAHAGARNASAKALMVSSLTSGGCNKCHCTGTSCTTSPLHLP